MDKLVGFFETLGYILFGVDAPGRVNGVKRNPDYFERQLPDGTQIFGPKSTEGRPGHRHGHKGSDFYRSPHSTIGSAAIGDPHNHDEHKKERTHRPK